MSKNDTINQKLNNMLETEMIYSDYRNAIMVICKCKEKKIPLYISPYKEEIKRMSNIHVVEEHTLEHKELIKQLTKEIERIIVTMNI